MTKQHNRWRWLVALGVLGLALALAWTPLARAVAGAAPTGYRLTWFTVDGGGDTALAAGNYKLSFTIGQPDADRLGAGLYHLTGGFWGGAAPQPTVYMPLALHE